ncbi:MAG TPA: PhoPQ-activated protein PqaA family protein [Candidatus Hydrogenedens sp.]|nr:PhoPQ-activated protein PqaA family protein [Candidatus Hydrogenedens sp.]
MTNRQIYITTTIFVLIVFLATSLISYGDLKSYVSKPDPSYKYELIEVKEIEGCQAKIIQLTSQTWQNIVWTHWLILLCPPDSKNSDISMLIINGGSNNQKEPRLNSMEVKIASMVAKKTSSIIAVLFQVPNQPLFDGRNEDEIISYTYDKYLNGEGDDWPLLLPMVKSAVRAMDTIQAVQKNSDNHEIKRFILTGGSKRGWTTWLTSATGDPRVIAIAPVVIDVLNMKQQMLHQLECYGTFSSEIEDYTRLKIPQRMHTPKGEQLLSIVDPYSYRNSMTLPKLIILGTNDPYWTVDSANLYFPDFPPPKYLCYQPNTGHDIHPTGVATLAEFFMTIKNHGTFPTVTWNISRNNTITVKWDNPQGTAYLWKADSNNRDFRNSKWESMPIKGKQKAKAKLKPPKDGWTAYYVEVRFPGSFDNPFSICTQMKVLPDNKYPFIVDKENIKAIPATTASK